MKSVARVLLSSIIRQNSYLLFLSNLSVDQSIDLYVYIQWDKRYEYAEDFFFFFNHQVDMR